MGGRLLGLDVKDWPIGSCRCFDGHSRDLHFVLCAMESHRQVLMGDVLVDAGM